MHSKLDIFSHAFNDNIPNYSRQGTHDPRCVPLAEPQHDPPMRQPPSSSARRRQNRGDVPQYPAYARAPVQHDTPMFGVADEVATCVLAESRDETYKAVNPRAPKIPRYLVPRDNTDPGVASYGFTDPVATPSSRHVHCGPQPHPYTHHLYSTHTAYAKTPAQYNDRQFGTPVGDDTTPRPRPMTLPKIIHQSVSTSDPAPVYASSSSKHAYQVPYPTYYPSADPNMVYTSGGGVYRRA